MDSVFYTQRIQACEPYQALLEGSLDASFCVIGEHVQEYGERKEGIAREECKGELPRPASMQSEELSASDFTAARKALISSANRLGFATDDMVWIQSDVLNAQELRLVVEAIDPRVIAVCDLEATNKLSKSYGRSFSPETYDALLGRPICFFTEFSSMLKSNDTKQKAWALLKKLVLT